MDSPSSSITLLASCACKNFNLSFSISTSLLPCECALCLCSGCRRVSGSCGMSFLLLPSTEAVDLTALSLTAYKSSERLVRYFCSTCGAHAISHWKDRKRWSIATGLLDHTEGVLKWTGCEWVEDTCDGGISIWLNSTRDADGSKRELHRWMQQDGSDRALVHEDALRKVSPPKKEGAKERLYAQCRCGGVKFYITRPNAASKTARSPFPDLIVPYHSGASANPENDTWWLRADDTKYFAGTCACTSCRVASGFEIQPWAFVPKCNIFQENGQEMEYNTGTLKRYDSSAGVYREFCGVCGATVFWHCEERPTLVDVSVGLLDPAQGARVEAWLDWCTGRVSFKEMAISRNLVQSLEDGLKASSAGNGGLD